MIEHTETDGLDDVSPHTIATRYVDGIGWIVLGETWTQDSPA